MGDNSIDFPITVTGGTYYVTQSGAGTGDGSSYNNAASVSTFNAESGNFSNLAGCLVYLCGTFNSTAYMPTSGTSVSRVFISLNNSSYPGFFDSSNSLDEAIVFRLGTNYVSLYGRGQDNIAIQNYLLQGILFMSSSGTAGDGYTNYVINMYVSAIGDQAFQFIDTTQASLYNIRGSECDDDGLSMHGGQCTVTNAIFENNGITKATASDGNGIGVVGAGVKCVGTNVTINNCYSEALMAISGGTIEINNLTIENYDNTGTTLAVVSANNATIKLNYFAITATTNVAGIYLLDASDITLNHGTLSITGPHIIVSIPTGILTALNVYCNLNGITDHALYLKSDSDSITHCCFANTSSNMALYKRICFAYSCSPTLDNLTFSDFSDAECAIYYFNIIGTVTPTNCIFKSGVQGVYAYNNNVGQVLNIDITNCCFYDCTTNHKSGGAATITITEANTVISDPLLNSYYRLKKGSPCIDAGVEIVGVTDGYKGTAPDIGWKEYIQRKGGLSLGLNLQL